MSRRLLAAATLVAVAVTAGCSSQSAPISGTTAASPRTTSSPAPAASTDTPTPSTAARALLPGMPAPLRPDDVWAADRPGALSPAVQGMPERVYVPNSNSDTVTVINPRTFRVLRTVKVGHEPQHVVPSWDLKTLWVNNDLGDSLTPINPATGHFGRRVRVADPYNLYFTPDGRYAVVMASALHELVFRDPHTMKVRKTVHVPCAGVNHADFTADGRFFLVSCEFSSMLLKVDTAAMTVKKAWRLPGRAGSMPQDVKLSTDGRVFYVADMMRDGLWVVDAKRFKVRRFIHTGRGAHGLYVTRDSRRLLVTNRGEGSISVLDMASGKLVDKWHIRGGGSPDMGGISADGKVFWVAGRYNGVVYAISTSNGRLLHKIKVGSGPHGLCIYPQPGRYSLGHTGVFR
ncbi:MAG: YncE family protein [Actinomycetes bacterium]